MKNLIFIYFLIIASSCKNEATREKNQPENSEPAKETIRETMDESGKLIKIKEINVANNGFSKRIIKYDLVGHELEEVLFFSDGTPAYKVCSHYDSHGNLIEKDFYQGDGTPDYVALYRYDANGVKTDLFLAKCENGSEPSPVWHILQKDNGNEVVNKLLYTRDNMSDMLHNQKTVENMSMYTDSLPPKMIDRISHLPVSLEKPISDAKSLLKFKERKITIDKFEYVLSGNGFVKTQYDEKGKESKRWRYEKTGVLESLTTIKYSLDGHEREITYQNDNSVVVFLKTKYDKNKKVIGGASFFYYLKAGFEKTETINGEIKAIYAPGM